MVEIDKSRRPTRFLTPQEVMEIEDNNQPTEEDEPPDEYNPELGDEDFSDDIMPEPPPYDGNNNNIVNTDIQEHELHRVLQTITASITRYIEERMKEHREVSNQITTMHQQNDRIPTDVYILVDLLLKLNEILNERVTIRTLGERILRTVNFYHKLIIFNLIFMCLLVFFLIVRYYIT